jgi:hypothetical protein
MHQPKTAQKVAVLRKAMIIILSLIEMIAKPHALLNLVLILVSWILHQHATLPTVITLWREHHIVKWQRPWMQLAYPLQALWVFFIIAGAQRRRTIS